METTVGSPDPLVCERTWLLRPSPHTGIQVSLGSVIETEEVDVRVSYLATHIKLYVGSGIDVPESKGRTHGRRALGGTWMLFATAGEVGFAITSFEAGRGNVVLGVFLAIGGGVSYLAVKAVGVMGNVRSLMPKRSLEESERGSGNCTASGTGRGLGAVVMGALAQLPAGCLVYVGTKIALTIPGIMVSESPLTIHGAHLFIDGIREARQRRDPELKRGFECRDRLVKILRMNLRDLSNITADERTAMLGQFGDLESEGTTMTLGLITRLLFLPVKEERLPETRKRTAGRYVSMGVSGVSGLARLALVAGLSYKAVDELIQNPVASALLTVPSVLCWSVLSYKYILQTGPQIYDGLCDWFNGQRTLSESISPNGSWGMLAAKVGLSAMSWGATSVAVEYVYGTGDLGTSQQVLCGIGAGLLSLAGLSIVGDSVIKGCNRRSKDKDVLAIIRLSDVYEDALTLIDRSPPKEIEKFYDMLPEDVREALE